MGEIPHTVVTPDVAVSDEGDSPGPNGGWLSPGGATIARSPAIGGSRASGESPRRSGERPTVLHRVSPAAGSFLALAPGRILDTRIDETVLIHLGREFVAAGHTELLEDVVHMVLQGLHGDAEVVCRFLVCVTAGD